MHLKCHTPRSFAALLCCFLLLMGVGLSACGNSITTGSATPPTAAAKSKVAVAYAGSLNSTYAKATYTDPKTGMVTKGSAIVYTLTVLNTSKNRREPSPSFSTSSRHQVRRSSPMMVCLW